MLLSIVFLSALFLLYNGTLTVMVAATLATPVPRRFSLPLPWKVRQSTATTLRQWIAGSFDNLKQSTADAKAGRPDAKSGGHEHIVAKIMQHPELTNFVVAAYFFGEEVKPFRFRFYEFLDGDNEEAAQSINPDGKYVTLMRLYKPSADFESQLHITGDHLPIPALSSLTPIPGADIGWRRAHWLKCLWRGVHYRGELVGGECVLPSQRDPSLLITIRDDLRLWPNQLWINDRVYAPDGTLLIGNSKNIPYKLQKQKQ